MRVRNLGFLTLCILALASLTACYSAPGANGGPAMEAPETSRGERIAVLRCSACHSVGQTGASPHTDAPAFRDLSASYSFESLRETLPEGLIVDHPDMPVFQLSPEETDALITYLEQIQAVQSAALSPLIAPAGTGNTAKQ